MEKIFIVGKTQTRTHSIGMRLIEINDDLEMGRTFISDSDSDLPNKYFYYTDNDSIGLDYENNALLFVTSGAEEYLNYGITLDEFYNKDVFCMTYTDFFNVSEYIFRNEPCVVIWVDEQLSGKKDDGIVEVMFGENLMNMALPYMYFTSGEDPDDIARTINEYVIGNEVKKTELIEENS